MSEGAQLLKDMIIEMKEMNKNLRLIIQNQHELEESMRSEFCSLRNNLTSIERNSSDTCSDFDYFIRRSQDYD